MSKIVEFPKHKIVRENLSGEDPRLSKVKLASKLNYADNLVEDIVDMTVEELEAQGIDVEEEKFMKDFSLAVDAIRAAVYRQLDLDHPLHDFIENNITMVDRKTGKVIDAAKDVDTEE